MISSIYTNKKFPSLILARSEHVEPLEVGIVKSESTKFNCSNPDMCEEKIISTIMHKCGSRDDWACFMV